MGNHALTYDSCRSMMMHSMIECLGHDYSKAVGLGNTLSKDLSAIEASSKTLLAVSGGNSGNMIPILFLI